MSRKPLSALKNGEKVAKNLENTPMSFDDLRRATFLNPKELQSALARLQKHGYVCKNEKGQWTLAEIS